MPLEVYAVVGSGEDALGQRWEVGVFRGAVCVDGSRDTMRLRLDGESLAEFAEAVARAQQLAEAHAAPAISETDT